VSTGLLERLVALRDEILNTAERGDCNDTSGDVFAAILRALVVADSREQGGGSFGLSDELARRLAWGEDETAVLDAVDEVCRRTLAAAQRALSDARDELLVIAAATEVGCAAARAVGAAALERAARDRAALVREELSLEQLRAAAGRQEHNLESFGRE
jgi:hypothetical protein